MTIFVLLALVVVVILVVVLVALGVRASRQGRDGDEEWIDEEQPTRGRRGALDEGHGPGDGYGSGYDRRVAGAPIGASPAPLGAPVDHQQGPGYDGYDQGYDHGYDQGYDPAYDQGYDAGYDQGGFEPQPPVQGRPPMSAPVPAPAPMPAPVKAPQPLSARRGKASEEMEDDDYWATITFDKPKFPWQHDTGHRPQGEDPLAAVEAEDDHRNLQAPAAATGPQPGYGAVDVPVAGFGAGPSAGPGPATGDNLVPGGSMPLGGGDRTDPFDRPDPFERPGAAAPTAPQSLPDPLGFPDPLGTPVSRELDRSVGGSDTQFFSVGESDLPPAPPHPSTMATQNFSVGSVGGPLGTSRGAGGSTGPLNTSPLASSGPLSAPTPPAPAPSLPVTPAPVASSGVSSGGQDTDGHRLPTVDELLQKIQTDRRKSSEAASPSSYGGSDPLSDPLGSGSGSSWSSSGSGSPSYGQDPLNTSGGYNLPSSGGYPATPAYGSDPLAGSSSSYGGFGGQNGQNAQNEPGSGGGEPGRYGDFSGSSYSGTSSSDPLGGSHGYPDAPASGGYGSGYPSEPSYGNGLPPAPEYGAGQDQRPSEKPAPGLPDDWDTYRGPRR